MKRIIRLTENQLIGLVKKMINEVSDHTKNLYRSWARKKSGNEEAALSIMDDVFTYLNKLPKKDFAKYESYEELKSDLDNLMGVEKEKSKEDDVEKLYEDDELLVVAAKTWEASCKYGAGSKWCTTAKDTSSHWKRHNTTGTEFFWVFKKKPNSDPNYKFSYHIKNDGGTDWCNAINRCSYDLPNDSYPKQNPNFNEIIKKLNEYHNARELFEVEIANNNFLKKLMFRDSLDRLLGDKIINEVNKILYYEYEDSIVNALREYEDEYGYEYDMSLGDIFDESFYIATDFLHEKTEQIKEQLIPLIKNYLFTYFDIDSTTDLISSNEEIEGLSIYEIINNINNREEIIEILLEILGNEFPTILKDQNMELNINI